MFLVIILGPEIEGKQPTWFQAFSLCGTFLVTQSQGFMAEMSNSETDEKIPCLGQDRTHGHLLKIPVRIL